MQSRKSLITVALGAMVLTVGLRSAQAQSKTLRISPFGHVMPFPLPPRQG